MIVVRQVIQGRVEGGGFRLSQRSRKNEKRALRRSFDLRKRPALGTRLESRGWRFQTCRRRVTDLLREREIRSRVSKSSDPGSNILR